MHQVKMKWDLQWCNLHGLKQVLESGVEENSGRVWAMSTRSVERACSWNDIVKTCRMRPTESRSLSYACEPEV